MVIHRHPCHKHITSLTLPAVKLTMGSRMIPSLASGILVQTAARTVMMAPDWKSNHRK